MGIRRSETMRIGICLAAVGSLFIATGCAHYRPARVGAESTEHKVSLKGTGCELGRGIVNIAFCWLEIPHEIEARVRESKQGHPFSIVSNSFEAVLGAVNGVVWGAERAIGGAFELVLSPFPPYDPIMEPALPPYLNFVRSSKEKDDSEKVVEQPVAPAAANQLP